MENTSNIYTNTPQKGLITDLHESYVGKELWTFARNVQTNSHLGQIQYIQNEPSNIHCVDLPYDPIGFVKLLRNRWMVFTTDNVNSEIGIFDETDCSYIKIINDSCLNFNKSNLITGTSKELFDCTESVYWTDGLNPRRFINTNKIPYQYDVDDDACKTKIPINKISCDDLLIEKLITIPVINTALSNGGNLKNGVYQFGIAYATNGQRVSEFNSISNPQSIWSHENIGQAIELNITNLDRDFEEYELIVVYTTEGVPTYKSLGFYSTATVSHFISNINRPEYFQIDLLEITVRKPRYPYADNLVSNDQYLLWSGIKTTPELNYQKTALSIKSKYVVLEVPVDYYANGGNKVGYDRDEVYPFAIQWLFDSGEWSPAYHIPGIEDNGFKTLASGHDVYEALNQNDSCEEPKKIERWMVENTAGPLIAITIQKM